MARPCGENGDNRIAKTVYVGDCGGSRSVGRARKRWIDTVKDCLKKKGLDVRQARIMVHYWLCMARVCEERGGG